MSVKEETQSTVDSKREEMKSQLEAEIKRTEQALAAQKLLLRGVTAKPHKPFIETSFGRAMNKFVVSITKPCAVGNYHAQERLQNPKKVLTQQAIDAAEAVIKRAQELEAKANEKKVSDFTKLAMRAAHAELVLEQYREAVPEFQDRIEELQSELAALVAKYRPTPTSEKAAEAVSFVGSLMEQMKNLGGQGGQEPEPQKS